MLLLRGRESPAFLARRLIIIELSASTLGCPEATLPEVLGWLADNRILGVELRLSGGQLADPVMTRAGRAGLRARIEGAGCRITGVASYVRVGSDAPDEMVLGAVVSAIDVAADLGAPAVRLFPGAPARPCAYDQVPETQEPRAELTARMAARLTAVSAYAADRAVLPCLETHDSHPTGELVAEVLTQVDGPVGVVWDLMHPWRVGERLEQSWAALSPWLARPGSSVQVKDAGLPASAKPVLLGQGTLPVDDFAELLIRHGYGGPVTLEWERAWHPDAEPLSVALVSFRDWAVGHWGPDT